MHSFENMVKIYGHGGSYWMMILNTKHHYTVSLCDSCGLAGFECS